MGHGGKRPNQTGRPKGSKNKATLEQQAVQEAYNQRVMQKADDLFHAQLTLALGSVRFFRVEEVGDGKNTKRVHVLVTDTDKIKTVLDETDGTDGAGTTIGEDYYFVTHILPDNKAIDSMLNRALGKPKDTLDIGNKDGQPFEQKIQVEFIDDKPAD
jgi:hypothetical protein